MKDILVRKRLKKALHRKSKKMTKMSDEDLEELKEISVRAI